MLFPLASRLQEKNTIFAFPQLTVPGWTKETFPKTEIIIISNFLTHSWQGTVYGAEERRKQLGNFWDAKDELANARALQVITLMTVVQYPGEPWDSKMRSQSLCQMLVSVTRVTKAAENRLFDLSEVTYKCDSERLLVSIRLVQK